MTRQIDLAVAPLNKTDLSEQAGQAPFWRCCARSIFEIDRTAGVPIWRIISSITSSNLVRIRVSRQAVQGSRRYYGIARLLDGGDAREVPDVVHL